MIILAIETSCDDTCAAVLKNTRVLSNIVSSQTDLHKQWGGVVPDIAKRAHQSRIKAVIASALKRSNLTIYNFQFTKNKEEKIEKIIDEGMKFVDVIAVTQGPGLAIALSIGVNTAKELAIKYNKKLVAINHVEGHLLSNLAQNKNGLPKREIKFPALAMTVSGGHTKLVMINKIGEYKVVGETLDDAAGEALDKAAKLLGLGYPGGPVIERVARLRKGSGEVKPNKYFFDLPHPLADKKILDYSFSGLKTSFYYKIKDWEKDRVNKNLSNLAATFQESVLELLIRKYKLAIEKYKPKTLLASGGVLANQELRKKIRKLAKEVNLPIFMPTKKILNTDNAAMIGVAGYFKAKKKQWTNPQTLDRDPRLNL